MSSEASRRTLLQIINNQLIPQAMRREPPSVVLMEPESLRRNRRELSVHAGKPLQVSKRMRSPILLQQWREQQLHASRFPCLLAVVEGEIDWRVGVTQQQKNSRQTEKLESDYLTVPITQGTFFLTPPGVPYSDGHGVHWERPSPRKGQAIIFWMIILPSGLMCHFCRSTATEHRSHTPFFLLCPPVYQLTRMLEKELSEETPNNTLIQAHLQAILIYVQRALEQQVKPVPFALETPQEAETLRPDMTQDALQRARTYIEAHFHQALNPDSVAEHAHLSSRHLERYFQRELGMSITDYIIRRRIEAARVLLQETDLLIRQVGEMVGYRNQSSFTQVFKRYAGISPRECRRSTPAKSAGSKKRQRKSRRK